MRPRACAALLAAALAGAACSGKEEGTRPVAPAERPRPPAAQYYYDLGPAEVDVSAYPARQREGYRLVKTVCGGCHTVARPLNAPHTDAAVWKRFLDRMHGKMEARGVRLGQADQERILEFLVYDSRVRKLESSRRAAFDQEQARLRAVFHAASGEKTAP